MRAGLLNLSGEIRRALLDNRCADRDSVRSSRCAARVRLSTSIVQVHSAATDAGPRGVYRPSIRHASNSEPTTSSSAAQAGSSGCCSSAVTR